MRKIIEKIERQESGRRATGNVRRAAGGRQEDGRRTAGERQEKLKPDKHPACAPRASGDPAGA